MNLILANRWLNIRSKWYEMYNNLLNRWRHLFMSAWVFLTHIPRDCNYDLASSIAPVWFNEAFQVTDMDVLNHISFSSNPCSCETLMHVLNTLLLKCIYTVSFFYQLDSFFNLYHLLHFSSFANLRSYLFSQHSLRIVARAIRRYLCSSRFTDCHLATKTSIIVLIHNKHINLIRNDKLMRRL